VLLQPGDVEHELDDVPLAQDLRLQGGDLGDQRPEVPQTFFGLPHGGHVVQ